MILALNIRQSSQAIEQFLLDNHYTIPVLMDHGAYTAINYGVSGIPATFFIDELGIIRSIKRGAFVSADEVRRNLDKIR